MLWDHNLLFVLGAWAFWGTYPVPFKSPAAKRANTDPFAFQFMKSICVCVTSWLILTWKEFTFTYWGFVGAALWIPAGLLFITSVRLTGVAFATPIANGTQVIVSFCWGAFYFKEVVHSAGLAVLAMIIMIVGMIGISVAVNWEKMQEARLAKQQRQQHNHYTINVAANNTYIYNKVKDMEGDGADYVRPPSEETPLIKGEVEDTSNDKRKFIFGVLCAIVGGFFGGTQNVPLIHAPAKAHGIQYVISFGIGAVGVIAIFTLVYMFIRWRLNMGLPTVNLHISIVPGSMAGVLWSCGNVCNIYATLHFGATIGPPLVMCNMMVAGLWGVFYYNEAPKLLMKGLFLLSCVILLGGVAMLSIYG